MEVAVNNDVPIKNTEKKKYFFAKKGNQLSTEDNEIIQMLNKVTKDLHFAQLSFDLAEDEMLTDSFIYEIMALHKRHSYYTKLCKERGLAADCF